MKRRSFMGWIGAAGMSATCGRILAAKFKRPNLLIIHTDEHNFRTLGCYRETLPEDQAFMWGPAVVETPNIDRIAHEGALCTHMYASTPVCSPSRSSFVTGKFPQNTPVIQNNIPMSDNEITFAHVLKKYGYATGYAGKWHIDGSGKPQWAPERQFGFDDNRYMYNRGHWKMMKDTPNGPQVGHKNGKPSYAPIGDEKTFTTDWLTDKAIEFIDRHKNVPFCYMLAIPDPHGPDTVREPYASMFAHQKYTQPKSALKADEGLPSWGKKQNGNYNQSKYYGMVKCIDDNVGKILRVLEKNGLMDNTIIVFTSDHGDLRGEHCRQNKGVPYEASAKIPFCIRWPKKIKAGTIVNESLGCYDFMPTILGLMEIPAAGTEEGRDASVLLTTGKAPAGWKDITFFRGTGEPEKGWIGAVTSRYKLILSPVDDPWLFDLEKDPNEIKNFFHDPEYREVIREMAQELLAYGDKYNDGRVKLEKITAELEWCVSGTGKFVSITPKPVARATGKRKKKGTRKRKKNTTTV